MQASPMQTQGLFILNERQHCDFHDCFALSFAFVNGTELLLLVSQINRD